MSNLKRSYEEILPRSPTRTDIIPFLAKISPTKPEYIPDVMIILNPTCFFRKMFNEFIESPYFCSKFVFSFFEGNDFKKIKCFRDFDEKTFINQNKENLKQKYIDLENDILNYDYDIKLIELVLSHLKLLSDEYQIIKNSGYDIKNTTIKNYYIFKSLYSYIYELILQFYPDLLLYVSCLFDKLIKLDYYQKRNTLSLLRNSFQHKNEILINSDYNLYFPLISNNLYNYTKKEIDDVLNSKNYLFIFNQHNNNLLFFTKIKVDELLKFAITSCHVLSTILTNKQKNILTFSHTIYRIIIEKYNLPTKFIKPNRSIERANSSTDFVEIIKRPTEILIIE